MREIAIRCNFPGTSCFGTGPTTIYQFFRDKGVRELRFGKGIFTSAGQGRRIWGKEGNLYVGFVRERRREGV
jgi:hypothetical protein